MGAGSPCASCKLLRRRCAKDCIFAPYFPSDDPQKFAIVHKVFGASNISKMLQEDRPGCLANLLVYLRNSTEGGENQSEFVFIERLNQHIMELPVHQRADAVSSLVYEANARMRDPVYGCVGAISFLQNKVSQLQMQLAMAQAEILCIQMQQEPSMSHQQMDTGDKSFLLHNNIASFPQFMNFASSSNVVQEPLKIESFWT